MDSLKARSLKALIWNFSAKFASQNIGFIATIILARLLEPGEFGTVALALALIGFSQIFSDTGLSGALIQRTEIDAGHYSSVFYFNLAAALFLSFLSWSVAPFLAAFFDNPDLLAVQEYMSVIFVLNALGTVQSAKLQRELRYEALAKARFSSAFLGAFVGVSMALMGGGYWSLVFQALSASAMYSLLLWIQSDWRPSGVFSIAKLRQLWGFGFRIFLAHFINQVFERIDIVVIAKIFSPAILGLYERAKALSNTLVRYSAESLNTVLFPVLSGIKDDRERYNVIVRNLLGLVSLYSFYIVGAVYLCAEEIVLIVLSEKWRGAIPYLELLAVSAYAAPIAALLLNVLSSLGKSGDFLRLEVYKKTIRTLCMVVGFIWGIEGYLYGLIVAASTGTLLNVRYAAQHIEVQVGQLLRPILIQATVAMVSVISTVIVLELLLPGFWLGFLMKIAIFSLVFLSVNHIFRTESYRGMCHQISELLQRLSSK